MKNRLTKKKMKSAISIVEDSIITAEENSVEKENRKDDAEIQDFCKAHPGVNEDLAAAILFDNDIVWTDEIVDSVADGCEEEIADFKQDYPWLTDAEAARYLYDPRLKWKGKPKDDDKETWYPVLKKDGSIGRLAPPFSAPDLVTDEAEYNRLVKEAESDEAKKGEADRRYYDAVKRDGYAQTDGWVPLWPKMVYTK